MRGSRLALFVALVLLGLAPHSGEPHVASGPSIGHYTLVESKTAPGYSILTFRAQLTNPLPYAITNVSAALTCRTVGATVLDGTVTFPDAEAGATVTSVTTFTLRLPRSRPFEASHLEWLIHFKKRNATPTANAGPDQSVAAGARVTLDGSGSRDPDGDRLTFSWKFVGRPSYSQAMLSNPYAVRPTFVADRGGLYVVELVVSDGTVKSAPDRVQISTQGVANTRPVANAGLDQTVVVNTLVQLDGSASTDADGDALTFRWRLLSTPPQSAAVLSDPAALRPTFRVDRAGTYVAELVVSDGRLDSVADTVQVSTVNSRPIAVAGADQTVSHGATVVLDGRASADVDGDPLTFLWSLATRPDGSQATLNDPTSPTPAFIADLPGRYEVRLIVNDGLADSTADTVQVDTVNSRPVADAGPDQDVAVGAAVHLDGTASGDADGDPLTFRWSFTTRPDGSAAAFDNPAAAQPSFVADRTGDYVAQLIVNDGFEDGLPDTVVVTTRSGNRPPVADAGPDQTVARGVTVQLDGRASSDPDGSPLTFAWTLLSRPNGSASTLLAATTATPSFVADVNGAYTAQLIVNDGALASAPDTVTITVRDGADLAVRFISPPNPTSPPVGSVLTPAGIGMQVVNNGPVTATGITARLKVPAGYTIRAGGPTVGTYDTAAGNWTVGTLVSGGFASLSLDVIVNATGPYDLTATITGSDLPDPDHTNDTVTVAVTPNRNADLRVQFISPPNPTSPPVGSVLTPAGIGLQVVNDGPATATGITARLPVPAGYTIRGGGPTVGTYDSATGNWTIGTLVSGGFATLSLDVIVNATGPYDLAATITGSDGPDPNPANNSLTVVVTPNRNADLRLSFFDAPRGTLAPGAPANLALEVNNGGPASTTGVTVSAPVPAGYTITAQNIQVGTYDAATGRWVVGALPSGGLARMGLSLRVDATGPTAITATITGSDQPDPNLTNNVAVVPAINRPPVANAGVDQSASTNTTVQLDGRASSDADGDALSFAWTFVLRPVNSTAALVGATTAIPTFVPDLAGTYRVQLVVTDTPGAASAPAIITITVSADNHPPVIRSMPITVATVGLGYRYGVDAIDPDAGDVVTLSLPTAPAGMTIDPVTGIIRWTPTDAQAGPQSVVVRAADPGGLFVTQAFSVQVSSTANRAPVAADDAYTARLGESLSIGAPGVLSNDTDADGTPLTAALRTAPTNGVLAFQPDGSFVYTPHTLQAGELVLADDADLIRAIPGTTFNMNGDPGVAGPPCDRTACSFDDNIGTMSSTFGINPATFEVIFPQDVTVTQVRVVAGRHPLANRPTSGIFRLLAADGSVLHDSGPVQFPLPDRDATLVLPGLAGVRRVRVTPLTGERSIFEINLAEVKVIGSALLRRLRTPEPNLAQLLPATVQAGSFIGFNVPESVIDDSPATSWYSAAGVGDFIEITFPVDVTVTGIETLNPGGTPDGFGSSSPILCHGSFQLLDASRTVLFDSGTVNTPFNDRGIGPSLFTLPVPTTPGVRSARYTVGSCAGSAFPAGFSEIRVLGTAPVTTPAFQLTKKFQALAGREVHSTPVVANLSDDNGDGVIDTRDIPDIVVAVESTDNQLTGEIKVLSGDDGRELFTLGPGLVSPWSEVAVGDIDGDGVPDIVAVHSDGNHLIAFDLAGGVVPGDLTQVLRPVTVNVSSASSQFLPAGGVDGRLETPWLTANGDAANLGGHPFFEVEFRQDVTVTQVQLIGNRGFTGLTFLAGFFQLFAADGSLLFDSGVVQLPPPDRDFTLTVPSAAGVRRVRFTGTDDAGASVGLTEFRVFGSAVAATGTPRVKWISDSNPMPRFLIGNSALIGGAVSIANLDGGPRPHIIVGASVFDADGRLLGDGRTLGGTTGGNGLRSAISAVVDLSLDGRPAIVAGPTAYRLVNGHLEIVWQRKDLPDGYVAAANFDDDPFPEIVVVADGTIYMLNHDGTDAQVWNPPTHAPVVTPGAPEGAAGPATGQSGAPLIVDVDGDGIPEIGIAKAANYLLYNRDGSLRWKAAISDRSSHSTGSVAFDFDGDGAVEIVYRDEKFLRIFRGADGVLLAKVPVQSATWAEQPVVVDVDNDGHADIVVTADLSGGLGGDTGVLVFRDVANKWTRTRRIWNQHSYHVTNVNEDGSIPRVEQPHWLVPGLNSFRTNAFVPGETADASDSFTYVATDGVLDSNVAAVRIAVNTPNSPPRFTSSAVTTAASGVRYVYAARATDPDAGDVLIFSLPTAPTGMTIEPATGLVQWTPTAGQLGSQAVVVKVHDARGLFALQSYSVQVAAPVTVPNVVGQPQATAQTTITNATLSVGSVGTHTSATVASGAIISQSPSAGTPVARNSTVNLVVSLGPPPIGTVPDVVGQPQGSAQADVTAAGFVLNPIVSLHSAVVPLGIVMSQSPPGGTAATAGSAVNLVVSLGLPPGDIDFDGDGFTGNRGDCNDTNAAINPNAADIAGDGADQNCNGRDSIAGDTTPPTVTIAAPAEDAVVTMPTDVVGTATDANFLRHTLLVAGVEEAAFRVIGSGTAPVVNGVLGRLDPTLLENGLYRVRLVAEDVNGQQSVDERVYRVDGTAKVGVLALSYVDLQVPVSGIPITVARAYDSRVKTQRDFGIGWSLRVTTGTYQNNRRPGDGWIVSGGGGPLGLPCQQVTESRSHVTHIRLSDRETYLFQPTLTNLAPVVGGCVGRVAYRLVSGRFPGATLQVLGNAAIIYTSGDVVTEFDGTDSTGLVFSPDRVRLTTADGRVVDLDRTAGITRIADRNGNALSVTPGGIVHSAGKSIAFQRDAAGRITGITDPQGATLSYGYDGNGDLTEFVDQLGARTTFRYDTRHNLLEVVDPLGRRPVRSEFDADGRLVAIIDANGGRVAVAHDLTSRQEVITDRLGGVTVVEYDERGNVVRRTDPLGNVTRQVYDDRDNVITLTDPLGRVATRTYDAGNYLAAETDAEGNVTRYTSDTSGNVLTVTDATGAVTTNVYDGRGNLVQTTLADGGVSRYTYDTAGNPLTFTDPLGNVSRLDYDAHGNQTLVVDALGNAVNVTYDASGNLLAESSEQTLPDGSRDVRVTRKEYDAKGQLARAIDGAGNAVRFTKDSTGANTAITAKDGSVARYEYDAAGSLTRVTFADGSVARSTYDAAGRRISRTDRDGNLTQYVYDAVGRVTRMITPDGASAAATYDPVGRALTRTDERGGITAYRYTPRRVEVTDPLGNVTSQEFDGDGPPVVAGSEGNVVRTVDARGNATTYTFDRRHDVHGRGRLTRIAFPDGTSLAFTYDGNGRTTATTDQAGHTTRYAYDALGQLTAVTDAAGATTRYAYDGAANLVQVTDANGHITRLEYDRAGRLTRRILPLGQSQALTYDVNGAVASSTDFGGRTTTYAYTSGHLREKRAADGRVDTYAYTPEGLRVRAGTDVYTYDSRGRVLTETKANGEVIAHTYDAAGNRTSVTTPHGTTTYTYDALDRLLTVTDPEAGLTRFTYDPAGNPATVTRPDGTTTAYTHDTLNRLTSQETRNAQNALVAAYAYTRGPLGTILRVVEGHSARTVDYTYDAVNRLTAETHADPVSGERTIAYAYDAVGNRLSKNDSTGGVTTYTYDANDRLTREEGPLGATTYSYDASGNLTEKTAPGSHVTYTYDAENRLAAIDDGTRRTVHIYDADGLRVRTTVNGTDVTDFLVDKSRGPAAVVRETNGLGQETASYVYGNGLLELTRPGLGSLYYHQDGQASVRQLTGATGAVSAAYTYDAYGNLIASVNGGINTYRYAGESHDASNNLYYLRARHYDPGSGRFTSRDRFEAPLSTPTSLHRYVYAQDDPVNRRDPGGLFDGLAGFSFGGLFSIAVANPDKTPERVKFDTTVDPALKLAKDIVAIVQGSNFPDQWTGSYERWFENPPVSPGLRAYYGSVKDVWDQIYKLAAEVTHDNFVTGKTGDVHGCGNRTDGESVAYVIGDGETRIYVCPLFLDPKYLATHGIGISTKIGIVENRARTIIHELAHETTDSSSATRGLVGVNDLGYGVPASLALAHPPGARARYNADNYALQAIEIHLGRELR